MQYLKRSGRLDLKITIITRITPTLFSETMNSFISMNNMNKKVNERELMKIWTKNLTFITVKLTKNNFKTWILSYSRKIMFPVYLRIHNRYTFSKIYRLFIRTVNLKRYIYIVTTRLIKVQISKCYNMCLTFSKNQFVYLKYDERLTRLIEKLLTLVNVKELKCCIILNINIFIINSFYYSINNSTYKID